MQSLQRALDLWTGLPGNWDTLHFSDLLFSDNVYGIPALARQDIPVPTRLMQWGSKPALLAAPRDAGLAVHFFLDDYRFESLWKNPHRNLDALVRLGCVLSPDFSLWREMPLAMQIWNTYRSRWLGAFWQAAGLQVIPTISWSQAHDFCYYGVERGSMVAISSIGIVKDPEARELFREGFRKMLVMLEPSTILCYGSLDGLDVQADVPLVTFPTRWEQRKQRAPNTNVTPFPQWSRYVEEVG